MGQKTKWGYKCSFFSIFPVTQILYAVKNWVAWLFSAKISQFGNNLCTMANCLEDKVQERKCLLSWKLIYDCVSPLCAQDWNLKTGLWFQHFALFRQVFTSTSSVCWWIDWHRHVFMRLGISKMLLTILKIPYLFFYWIDGSFLLCSMVA